MQKKRTKIRVVSEWQGEKSKRQCQDQTMEVGEIKALHNVCHLVAQTIKAHTIAESLDLPGGKTLVRKIIEDEVKAKLDSVSLSNDV